jgi:hypothetical protein
MTTNESVIFLFFKNKQNPCQVEWWQYIPIIPALGRLRQEGQELKAIWKCHNEPPLYN